MTDLRPRPQPPVSSAAMISHVCTRYGDGSLPFRKLCPACQEIARARARDPKHAASGLDAKRSVNDGLRRDFPLLWEKAEQHDFAERLGGSTDPLMAEIDAAMRELHSARFGLLGLYEEDRDAAK